MTDYQLGIDLGTTFTAAAVCRDGGAPEPVQLGGVGPVVPTVVHLGDDGTLLIGEAAQRRALTDPRRTVREFKRRIGDSTPLVVAGRAVPAAELAARFVAEVVDVAAALEGGPAGHVVLTHPAEWGEHRRSELAAALAAHGLPGVTFRTEPEAAAVGYACGQRLAPGDAVAVYDLGGGTFDAAVVRRTDEGFALLGRPGGVERLGGVDFDDRVFTHVRDALGPAWDALDPGDPEVLAAAAALRRECTAAKEALSVDTEVLVPVMLPGVHTRVRLGRAEFEDMIRPSVVESIEALRRAMDSAGVSPAELRSVLLVGGSSRIPLVSQLLSAELGRPVSVDVDPKAVIAAGAALAAQAAVAPAPAPAPAPPVDAADEPGGAPDAPAVAFAAAPGPVPAPGRRRRTLVAAAAVGVVAVFATVAGVATAWDVLVPGAAGAATAPAAAADGAPVAAPPIDPWTGTAPAETTLPGPRRPRAVAAVVRPVARNVPTGATGAAPQVPAAVPRAGAPAAPAAPGAAPGRGVGGTGAGGGGAAGGVGPAVPPPGPVTPPPGPVTPPPGPVDPPPGPVDPPPGPVNPPPGPADPPPGPVNPPPGPVDPPPGPVDPPPGPVDPPSGPVNPPPGPVDPPPGPADPPPDPVDPPAEPVDPPADPVDPPTDPPAGSAAPLGDPPADPPRSLAGPSPAEPPAVTP